MADYEYDSNYGTWLTTAGATGFPTPVSIRGVIKYLCTQVGLVGGGTKAAQVGKRISLADNQEDVVRLLEDAFREVAAAVAVDVVAKADPVCHCGLPLSQHSEALGCTFQEMR